MKTAKNAKAAKNAISQNGQPDRLPNSVKADKLYLDRLKWHAADRSARRDLDEQDVEREAALLLQTMPHTEALKKFLARPKPPREWTVPGVWERGANALLAAEFKSGKTVLCMNLMRSLCDEVPFLGREVTRRGGIWFWNCELTEAQCDEWFKALGIANPAPIHVLNLRGVKIPDLRAPAAQAWAAETLIDLDIKHWFIDPWRRICREENNNDLADEMTQALDIIKLQAGNDIDLFLTHHFGRAKTGEERSHSDERSRGATRVDDWADDRLVLVTAGNTRFFRTDRGRDTDFEETALKYDRATRRIDVGEGNRADAKAGAEELKTEAMAISVKEMVKKHPLVGAEELRRLFKGTAAAPYVDAGRDRAVEKGWLEMEVGKHGKHHYKVTSK